MRNIKSLKKELFFTVEHASLSLTLRNIAFMQVCPMVDFPYFGGPFGSPNLDQYLKLGQPKKKGTNVTTELMSLSDPWVGYGTE